MKDRLLTALYVFLFVLLSSLRSWEVLSLALLLTLALLVFYPMGIREKSRILRRALLSSLLFVLLVSIPYVFMTKDMGYLLMVMTRVLSLMLLTFLFLKMVNPFAVLSFSKSLSFILVLSVSQITSYLRLLREFEQAFKSRSPHKPRREEYRGFLGRVLSYFFEASARNSEEVYQAMKSRGFDID
ncbi:MAG: ABC transporter permease [Acidobacteria bacterium]|nr:MAG: ABC transporter permease [Acidobacteriota bacterium]